MCETVNVVADSLQNSIKHRQAETEGEDRPTNGCLQIFDF